MSIKLMSIAWDTPLKGADKLILLALCDFANDEGVCYPSISTIAKKSTSSERTVSYAIKTLEKIGVISHEKRSRENGSRSSNVYKIDIKSLFDIDFNEYKTSKTEVSKPQKLHTTLEDNQTAICDNQTAICDNQTATVADLEPSVEPSDKNHQYKGGGNFDLFWKAYPKKVGKIHAQKAYTKAIKKTTHEIIVSGLENQLNCKSWKKDDGQYIPHASTWLNGERWNDEITTVTTPTTQQRREAHDKIKAQLHAAG